MPTEINHVVYFQQSPEQVWEYITNSELIELWLMKNTMKPVLGYQFQFKMRPLPELKMDGIVYCTIMELEPFKKLTYSWKCGPGDGKLTLDSMVYWTLEPSDKGTALHLRHTGFNETEHFTLFGLMDKGWLQNMQKIVEFIKTPAHGATNA